MYLFLKFCVQIYNLFTKLVENQSYGFFYFKT